MKLLRRRKLDRVVKDAYWDAVSECLVDLFGVPKQDAQDLSRDRRALVDLAPRHLRSDIFYHREPFDVASSLASSRLPTANRPSSTLVDPAIRGHYESILKRHGLA